MNLTRTAVAVFLLGWLVAPAVLRSDCSLTSVGIAPLNEAGPRFYLNFPCGLYPRGGNSRPPSVDPAALAPASQIQPLDSVGAPDAAGKIVLLSIGLSNTTQEFGSAGAGAFKPRADADPSKSPRLTIVDGAQGRQDAAVWADPNNVVRTTTETGLTNSGATPAQDPDVDGLTNLAEYKLGTNPKTPDSGLVTAQFTAGHLTMTFPRAKFATEATITVEAAAAPIGPWSSGPLVTAEQTTGDDGIVEIVVATDLATGASPVDRLAPRVWKVK